MAQSNRNTLELAACAICPGVVLGVFMAFPVWAPAWMGAFGVGRSSAMMIYSASGILMTLSMPVVGRLLTRVAAWRLILLGAVIMGGGILLASVVRSYPLFIAIYALGIGPGVALAGLLPCQSLAARLFPSRLGAIAGLMMMAMAAMGVVLPIVLTRLETAIGWREAFASTGILVLAVLVPIAIVVLRRASGSNTAGVHADQAGTALLPTRLILQSGRFWIIWAGMLPMMATPNGIQANIVSILADHGMGALAASYVLSAFAVGTALGAVLFGWLADFAGPRFLMSAMALLMAGALVALAGGGGIVVLILAAVALGLAGGGVFPMGSVLSFQQFGAGYAPALGLLNACLLPYIFTPPLIGYIRDRTGSYSAALLVLIPMLLLGMLAIWRLRAPDNSTARTKAEAGTRFSPV